MEKSAPRFLLGAASATSFPPEKGEEYVFVGPSNVGKSSLINAVARRKIARISKTPGCTRQINFFELRQNIFIVDMPGYGYAKVSQKERKEWKNLIETYLLKRKNIKQVFALLDSRRNPSEKDIALFDWLKYNNLAFFVVLTKIDKISKSKRRALIQQFVGILNVSQESIIPTSALVNINIESLRVIIGI